MSRFMKFIVQVVVSALSVLVIALSDERVDASEWNNVVIAVLGTLGVLLAGETLHGAWSHAKTIVAAGSAAAVALQSFLTDGGVSGPEWIQVAVVALGVIATAIAPGPKVEPVVRAPGAQVPGVADHAA